MIRIVSIFRVSTFQKNLMGIQNRQKLSKSQRQKTKLFRQKLPIQTTHRAFLIRRHPDLRIPKICIIFGLPSGAEQNYQLMGEMFLINLYNIFMSFYKIHGICFSENSCFINPSYVPFCFSLQIFQKTCQMSLK